MTKKQENNRDIFDKALDYAPVLGAVAGWKLGRRGMGAVSDGERAYISQAKRYQRSLKRFESNPGPANERRLDADAKKMRQREREWDAAGDYSGRSAVAGATAGAGATYIGSQEIKKRRK